MLNKDLKTSLSHKNRRVGPVQGRRQTCIPAGGKTESQSEQGTIPKEKSHVLPLREGGALVKRVQK